MKFIDYVQLNPFQKIWYDLKKFILAFPTNFMKVIFAIGRFFKKIGVGIGKGFAGYVTRFIKGDWATKLSYVVMGFGNMLKGQIVKGALFLAAEVGFIFFMIGFGWDKIYNLGFFNNGTVGFNEPGWTVNARGNMVPVENYDDSMLLLLYGVMTIIIIAVFLVCYVASTKSAYKAQQMKAAGEPLPGFLKEVKQFGDEKFHTTLLAFPTLTISIFTIMPLIFMILTAFTNFGDGHLSGQALFRWQGFQTFAEVFKNTGGASMGKTFVELTKWTLLWAVLATVVNYILGMVVALMINKKGIKLKALWRTLFVVTVAVPQFVSLLLMSQMLTTSGAINVLLGPSAVDPTTGAVTEWHLGLTSGNIDYLGDLNNYWMARITVLVVNVWVGIPYTILITSGILMNIPADLYESATIDGAGPVTSFFKITLPYMLFVTTPYLITTFIGNINNFNVIYLLCGGRADPDLSNAAYTDLLVTWLFRLTMDKNAYNYAAAIGILVFIVCATVSLLTFNLTKSAKNEEEFS